MPSVSMRQLLEAGVHFGHQTRRWNPKMRPYIFAERNGIHIIDLAQTVRRLDPALEFVRETAARGDTILFVGTKKQAQEPIAEEVDPGRDALRQPALAGRHAHQLRDHPEAARPARAARGSPAERRVRAPHEEGGQPPHRRDEQARADPRRHPQDAPPAGRDVRHRPAARATSRSPRRASSRSRSSAPATPTSIRTCSTTSSRPTTTPSGPSGCCARSSPTRPSRAPRSAPRGRWTSRRPWSRSRKRPATR